MKRPADTAHDTDTVTEQRRDPGVPARRRADRDAPARHRIDPEIAAIVEARHGDPFAFLGMHTAGRNQIVVRAMLPGAEEMAVLDKHSGEVAGTGARVDPAGFFVATLAGRKEPFDYRLRVLQAGVWREFDDVYRFAPVLGDLDVHLLAQGDHRDSYLKLGAHPLVHEGAVGVAFAVWAPNARRVSVVGDFNDWDGRRLPMRLRHAAGVWELFVPGLRPGHFYKYEILGEDGRLLPLKSDPYAEAAERPPGTASVVVAPTSHVWQDGEWMAARAFRNDRAAPIAVYEVHLGSWRRNLAERGRYLSYRELADQLVPYVAEMGFTHIEILPVMEYPFDGSWGYQPISLFAPTSRFGSPDDFRFFVDACHQAGIGVWLDWVPGHFPTDAHGLARFDGTALYEHADPRQGMHREWNTLIYNYGRREVANFLLSSALCWLREFHIDGLRVDAVASMLYLDYSRNAGEWVPNAFGGRENLEAIGFLRRLNELAFGDGSGATTVAEESTAWPMVSRPVYVGGLGFGFKWNMGWMHDTLGYISKDPIHRKYQHNNLTFGLLYAFHENFILPLSHDEVVYGKGSLLGKMPGDRWQRFANLRAYLAFMWTHPGKKLLFMGGEFGQEREWNHDIGLDWQLLGDPMHEGVRRLVRDLNRLYRDTPALHRRDCEADGFAWIDANNGDESVLSYLRMSGSPGEVAVIACNFTPVPRLDYRIGVPQGGFWAERINSDAEWYGGSGVGNLGGVTADAVPMHGQPHSLRLQLPPLGVVILTAEP
jgi:1,4-alpha-glucan branching enzyme